eukprot:1291656-Rhodomonas_salina.1
MTFSWRGFSHPEYTTENPEPDHVLEALAEVIWQRIHRYWDTGEGIQANINLVAAIRTVTAAGKTHTPQLRHQHSGGWWTEVDLPMDQQALLMGALMEMDPSPR